jgi:hypothetical protein
MNKLPGISVFDGELCYKSYFSRKVKSCSFTYGNLDKLEMITWQVRNKTNGFCV